MSFTHRVKWTSRRLRDSQSGFALVEIVVSALVLAIVAGGALTALQASGRTGAEERHRAHAHAVASDDQARLRSMTISALIGLDEMRTVTVDGTRYTVESKGQFVNDTGTDTCVAGTATVDYTRITSMVSWPSLDGEPPVVVESIVAPPSGSIPGRGALQVEAIDAQGAGIPGLGLSGTGAGSFSGTTGATGCARFRSLPAGDYTLTLSATGVVDANGNPPEPQEISVVDQSTNTVVLQYDEPGSIVTTFESRGYLGSGYGPARMDSVMVFNTGMSAAKAVPSQGGSLEPSITADSLFPFTSTYTVYAGTCTGDNPATTNPPGSAAMKSVTVPAGGQASALLRLPALRLTAYRGTNTSSIRAADATVWVRDTRCGNLRRTYTTNVNGQLADAGGNFLGALPYSVYDVCVKGTNTTGGTRWVRQTVALNTSAIIANPPTVSAFLGSGSSTNPNTQACPA
jgi:Tfp pilus assembly protein PilV